MAQLGRSIPNLDSDEAILNFYTFVAVLRSYCCILSLVICPFDNSLYYFGLSDIRLPGDCNFEGIVSFLIALREFPWDLFCSHYDYILDIIAYNPLKHK